ncbi:aspartyl protease family protein [Leeuwenhoekiella polynyae]|uniref:Aspartyl protease n=1 Tax=Leeuwenhoekiella polynyae TaxID=1550906 RepID=A0A4Q0PEL2_9FLAO|nr:aspartyl protease family protein [Leeuwenhoekiella polynyae]RXG25295.1 aspartyl protease [Leeuwenhoekiella polynyae]
MRIFYFLSVLVGLLSSSDVSGQGRFLLPEGEKSIKIKAKVVNNLMIIPVQVNGLELSFLLDTGVRSTILFGVDADYQLELNNKSTVWLRGAGDGKPSKAIKSTHNIINIGSAAAINQTVYYIPDSSQNFSPRLGFPVHGIIGYSLLKDLGVEMRYDKALVKLYLPEVFKKKKCRSCVTIPFELKEGKPYVDLNLVDNNQELRAKLLLDSGSGDALWLFEETHDGIEVSKNSFKDHLGLGLNGEVLGSRSRIKELKLGDFALNHVNVAYPDSSSLEYLNGVSYRNGSLGSEVLRRFTVYLDYDSKTLKLKKNKYFDNPFRYNRSGLVVEHTGFELVAGLDYRIQKTSTTNDYSLSSGKTVFLATHTIEFPQLQLKPNYEIAAIRENSPGAEAGLNVGDRIIKLNGRDVTKLDLNDITKYFYRDEGEILRLKVDRKGYVFTCKLKLRKLLEGPH